jgi:putative FmdB family regulatory protein
MPTYQYVCKNCRHEFEELQTMSELPLVTCPSCKQDTLARVMGMGGGLIFKGTGFYLTDYVKNQGTKKASAKLEKKTSEKSDAGAAAPTTESKSSEQPKDSSAPPDTKKE